MRKPVLATLILASATMFSGCGEDVNPSGSETGRIAPSVDLDTKVVASRSQSRAEADRITVGDLQLRLTAADGSYSNSWTSIAEFPVDTEFKVGSYTIEAFYGDIAEEGFEKPYYYGSQELTVAPDKTTDVALSASLANSMVTVVYTDAFRNYMTSFGATLHSAGGAYINYADDETRPVYLRPGNVTLSVALTKPNGKSATVEAANFTAEGRHHYTVTVDVNNGNVGDAVLTVSFDDTLDEESVEIELSDELMNAPAPTATPQGFTPDTPIELVAGDAIPSCKMSLIARGKLSSVTLTTNSASLLAQGWPAEVNLMALSAAERATLSGLGLSTLGLWNNPDQMAIVDFSAVLPHISYVEGTDNQSTFTLVVKDRFSKVSEPLTLAVSLEPVVLNITDPQLIDYGTTSTLSFNLEFNGNNPESNVVMQYANDRGTWTNVPFSSIAPASRATSVYAASVEVPSCDSDILLRAVYKTTSAKSQTVKFQQPSFRLAVKDADVFTATAKATMTDREGNAAAIADEAALMISTDGKNYSSLSPARDGIEYSLTGLTPATTYYIKAVVNKAHSKPTVFTTEAAAQLPGSDMEKWTSTKKGDYQYLWVPESPWQTVNELTCSTSGSGSGNGLNTGGCAYKATSGTIPANGRSTYSNSYGGTFGTTKHADGHTVGNATIHSDKGHTGNAALIRTVGYGTGNSAGSSTGNPASGFNSCQNVAAGELFLGEYNNGAVYSGYTFTSRPKSLSFYYHYTSYGSSGDYGDCEIIVMDALGNPIASASKTLTALSAYDNVTLPLNYTSATKAAKIMVRFKSSANPSLTNNSTWLYGPGNKNVSGGEYVGSELYIDDIQLNY